MGASLMKSATRRMIFGSEVWRGCAISGLAHLVVFVSVALLTIPTVRRPQDIIIPMQFRDETIGSMPLASEPLLFKVSAAIEVDSRAPLGIEESSPFQIDRRLASSDRVFPSMHGAAAPDPERLRVREAKSLAKPLHGAQFFGLQSAGQRFVFVVDCSSSMQGPSWEAACRELLRSCRLLEHDQAFYVIFFDGQYHPMFDDLDPEPALIPATSENIARLTKWFRSIQLGNRTEPWPAVRVALSLGPDAIFLLSDGEFSPTTRLQLRRFNRRRSGASRNRRAVVVNTIALRAGRGARNLLRIARENGGKHVFVDVFRETEELATSSNPVALPAKSAP